MAKPVNHSWFKFEWAKWRNDPQLRRCSKETRGFWIDAIAAMEELDTYFLEGEIGELCRDLICTRDEFDRSVAELLRTGAATIVIKSAKKRAQIRVNTLKSQDAVKIISRKILKGVNLTEYNKVKKRESRERQRVKNESTSGQEPPLKNREEREEREERIREEEKIVCVDAGVNASEVEFIEKALTGIRNRMNVNILPKESLWCDAAIFAMVNGFSVEQFGECFDLLKKQHWRKGPITPDVMQTNLPNMENLRKEIEEQNASSKKPNTSHQHRRSGSAKRSDRPEETTEDFLNSIGAKPL